MTTKIGISGSEATVPDPHMDTYRYEPFFVQSSQRALDGTNRRQLVTQKRRWHVEWRMVDATMRSTIMTELNRAITLSFITPEGSTYSVMVNSYNVSYKRGTSRANIECDLEQA
jgi:hypothetical protein